MSYRLKRQHTGLIVIDIQERLLPAMFEKERVVQNARRLVQGAMVLNIPIIVTEQYRKGLGQTIHDLSGIIPSFCPLEKLSFSACGANGFIAELKKNGLNDLLLCGIESHVCVCQTCLDLLDFGFRSFIVGDAVSSRNPQDYRLGLERMRQCGASIVSTEMALFELTEEAGSQEFKQILSLVK